MLYHAKNENNNNKTKQKTLVLPVLAWMWSVKNEIRALFFSKSLLAHKDPEGYFHRSECVKMYFIFIYLWNLYYLCFYICICIIKKYKRWLFFKYKRKILTFSLTQSKKVFWTLYSLNLTFKMWHFYDCSYQQLYSIVFSYF